jgi:hypothetical protein
MATAGPGLLLREHKIQWRKQWKELIQAGVAAAKAGTTFNPDALCPTRGTESVFPVSQHKSDPEVDIDEAYNEATTRGSICGCAQLW